MSHRGPGQIESTLLDDLSGRTVLVTGGAGFIGSHLCDALAGTVDLRVLDSLATGRIANVPPEAQFIRGSIGSEPALRMAMQDVDVVFHHAAEVSVPDSIDRPVDYHDTNVTGTLRLLEIARQVDARVVLASSAAVYGEPSALPITEDELPTPTSPYGASKLAADFYTQVYSETYDLDAVVLRYFNVYGPRQQPGGDGGVIATFVDRAIRGEPLVINGDGEQTRDFVYADDVVRANLTAATATDASGVFNIGTGDGVSIRELAHQVGEVLSTAVDIRYGRAREGDVRHSRADISSATRDLGYEPQVTLEDGLAALASTIPAARPP